MAEAEQKDAPIVVLVSGAAGQIGYALCPMIASGQMFGPNQRVIIRALEINIPAVQERLRGCKMEMQDCAYPLLADYVMCNTDEPEAAWKDIDYAVLVGGMPRKDGMNRADLAKKNVPIFKTAGECLEKYAKATTKVLVVANPANTNCRVCAEYAPKIPKENFCALTRLDFNRARGYLANHLGVKSCCVKNVVIWGNHSKSQVPDLNYSTVDGMADYNGASKHKELNDVENEADSFMHIIAYRGGAIIKARQASSACSAANAACNNIRDWHLGTPEGETVAMSVWAGEGYYGIKGDVFYSFPVSCKDGSWTVKTDFSVNEDINAKMQKSLEELNTEWSSTKAFLAEK